MVEVRGHSVDRLDARSSASDASGSDGQRLRGRRARSAQRYVDTKPKRRHRYFGSAGSSLTSIPGKIQLSMLNSGLIPIGERPCPTESGCAQERRQSVPAALWCGLPIRLYHQPNGRSSL